MKLSAAVLPLLFFLALLPTISGQGQLLSEEVRFLNKLKQTETPIPELLSSRAAVLFSAACSQADLEEVQKGFQQIGIDAIVYVESERALAGRDLMNAYSLYFLKRNIRILVFLNKEDSEFRFYFVPFNGTAYWVEPDPTAWYVHSLRIGSSLQTIYRSVISTQKRQNLLVNDYPEKSGPLSAISRVGRRDENLAPNVRVFKIAVPKTGDVSVDADLEKFLKENFPTKYEIVEANITEKDLLQKGFVYILRFIHAPGSMTRQILGYEMDEAESTFMTARYEGGTLQLKTIPAESTIYKFYIKHLEDEIFYLGLKWDADVTWQEALKNHLDSYRAAGRFN